MAESTIPMDVGLREILLDTLKECYLFEKGQAMLAEDIIKSTDVSSNMQKARAWSIVAEAFQERTGIPKTPEQLRKCYNRFKGKNTEVTPSSQSYISSPDADSLEMTRGSPSTKSYLAGGHTDRNAGVNGAVSDGGRQTRKRAGAQITALKQDLDIIPDDSFHSNEEDFDIPASNKRQKPTQFQEDWEDLYCVIEMMGRGVCLLCGRRLNIRHAIIERHFNAEHSDFDEQFPPASDARGRRLRDLKAKLLGVSSSNNPLDTGINLLGVNKPSVPGGKRLYNKEISDIKERTDMAAIKITHVLAKHHRLGLQGNTLKQLLTIVAEELLISIEDGKNQRSQEATQSSLQATINNLNLDSSAIESRVGWMSTDLRKQLANDLERCSWFSLQLAPFDAFKRHNKDAASLADAAKAASSRPMLLLVRMAFEDDGRVQEELLTMWDVEEAGFMSVGGGCDPTANQSDQFGEGRRGHLVGRHVYEAFKAYIGSQDLSLKKMAAISVDCLPGLQEHRDPTDGSTSADDDSFISCCRVDPEFPATFLSYTCNYSAGHVVGQLLLDHVTHVHVPAVNMLKELAAGTDHFYRWTAAAENRDIMGEEDDLSFAEVDRLSTGDSAGSCRVPKGVVLGGIIQHLDLAQTFFKKQNNTVYLSLLGDKTWLMELAFLADILAKVDHLNQELAGSQDQSSSRDKDMISSMLSTVNTFKSKLSLWKGHLINGTLGHYQCLALVTARMGAMESNLVARFLGHMDKLIADFNARFSSLQDLESTLLFLRNPFHQELLGGQVAEVTSLAGKMAALLTDGSGPTTEQLELEILELTNNIKLKATMKACGRQNQSDGDKESGDLFALLKNHTGPHQLINLKHLILKLRSMFGSHSLSLAAKRAILSMQRLEILKANGDQTPGESTQFLADYARISLSSYTPNYKKVLTSEMEDNAMTHSEII